MKAHLLTPDELADLKPSNEQLFKNTRRATMWYNEAPYTAAALFIEAAHESEQFRKDFMSEEKIEVEAFPESDGRSMVKSDKWRQTMKEEVPDLHETIMDIPLSAAQGGHAENLARKVLNTDSDKDELRC